MSMPAPDQPHGADPGLGSTPRRLHRLPANLFADAERFEFPEHLLTVISADDAVLAFNFCRFAAEAFLRLDDFHGSQMLVDRSSPRHQTAAIRILPASPQFPRGCTIFDCVASGVNEMLEKDERVVARANQILESLRLSAVRNVPAAALPAAAQWRVALAQMLVMRPRVLIAEPAPAHIPPRQQMQHFHLLRAAAIEGELVVLYPTSDARFVNAASSVIAISGEHPGHHRDWGCASVGEC